MKEGIGKLLAEKLLASAQRSKYKLAHALLIALPFVLR
jgi:hypothetical protein